MYNNISNDIILFFQFSVFEDNHGGFYFLFFCFPAFLYHAAVRNRIMSKNYRENVKNRSRRSEVFCKKGVLRNFTKSTGKQLCQSLLIKLQGASTLFKKRLWHRCFPVIFTKFLRTPFLTEHTWWLVLNLH